MIPKNILVTCKFNKLAMRFQINKLLHVFIAVNLFISLSDYGIAQVVKGVVTDANLAPIPYATLFVEQISSGTITNLNGEFFINLPRGNYNINIRSLGYLQLDKTVEINTDTIFLQVKLERQEYLIKEVKVFPGKEDPAYFIVRKAMAKARFYREQIKHYEAELYVKSNFTFTNIPKLYQNKIEIEGQKMKDVFRENMTYVIESQNKITFDYPQKYVQEVLAKKTSLRGFDEPPVMGLITSNFYEERPNQVISPLSPLALKHYNYRYEGFITSGEFDVFKIKVTPKRKSDELVDGHIYIVDKLWCIYNVDFKSRFEFFDYQITQQYQNLGKQTWLPVSHYIKGNLSILGLKANFNYGASLTYKNIETNNFENSVSETPKTQDAEIIPQKENKKELELRNAVNLLNAKEELSNRDVKKVARLNRQILKEQYKDSSLTAPSYSDYEIKDEKDTVRTDTFSWDTIRSIPLTVAEIKSYQFADSLEIKTITADSAGVKKEKSIFKKIVGGHPDFTKDSLTRLSYNGLLSLQNFGFNAVDGYSFSQKFRFVINPDSGKYITFIPQIGYAFNRKVLLWIAESQFRNLLAKHNTFTFKFGKESRDFKPGNLEMNPQLDLISAWYFAENYKRYYQTGFFETAVSQQLAKNLVISFSAAYNNFQTLQNSVSYLFSDEKDFHENVPGNLNSANPALENQKSFETQIGLRYRKNLKKPWLEQSPFLFMGDFYSVSLNFNQGIKNVFSSVSDFSRIDFSVKQQANISPGAGIEWQINAGHFFTSRQMFFSQFKHFNTAEILVPFSSFTHTFQMLNDYIPSTNRSYVNAGFEFRTEYILLRYLSFINTRTWSESLHLNYLSTPELKNYYECGYSLNSLFFAGNVGVFAGFNGNSFENIALKISISGF